MADVDDTIAEWSSTTASNKPTGATTIGTGLDDNLREIQGVLIRGLSHKGADIASVAGTTDIGAVEGLMHDITGTETITGFGTVRAGIWKILKYEAAATLTHNATSLILLGGADRTTANGDTQIVMSEGSGNWRELAYFKASGASLHPLTSGTEQATTSGTAINFTGIPSWAKKITIQFVGVSTDGTAIPIIQIGDSGGLETTGYLGSACQLDATPVVVNHNTGFAITGSHADTNVYHGALTLTLEDAAAFTWAISGVLGGSDAAYCSTVGGTMTLTAALDRLTLTTVAGAGTFDAGSINILYE